MTGVSLAGTQLRVNQYNLHDTEWNDITVSVALKNKFLPIIIKPVISRLPQSTERW